MIAQIIGLRRVKPGRKLLICRGVCAHSKTKPPIESPDTTPRVHSAEVFVVRERGRKEKKRAKGNYRAIHAVL